MKNNNNFNYNDFQKMVDNRRNALQKLFKYDINN